MSKVYANEINEKEEEQKLPKKEFKQDEQKQDMKEGSDTAGASGFSDDVEKKFQEKKRKICQIARCNKERIKSASRSPN